MDPIIHVSIIYNHNFYWSDATGQIRLSDKFCQAEGQRSRSVNRSGLQSRYSEETESRIAEISEWGWTGPNLPADVS